MITRAALNSAFHRTTIGPPLCRRSRGRQCPYCWRAMTDGGLRASSALVTGRRPASLAIGLMVHHRSFWNSRSPEATAEADRPPSPPCREAGHLLKSLTAGCGSSRLRPNSGNPPLPLRMVIFTWLVLDPENGSLLSGMTLECSSSRSLQQLNPLHLIHAAATLRMNFRCVERVITRAAQSGAKRPSAFPLLMTAPCMNGNAPERSPWVEIRNSRPRVLRRSTPRLF